ncbi:condensation domain-containing protein [Embleya sp. NPDC059237]|uniref:condensation domain-containing protein n=1 Tax=Embleya sp. NPDC059237 TaxID=3346784 RepID=UPI0036C8DAD4
MTATPTEALPATPVQEQMWLVDEMDREAAVYNEHLAFRLTGPLSVPALEAGFDLLVERHAALRTILPVDKGRLRQTVVDPWSVRLDAPPDFTGRPEDALDWARRLVEEPYRPSLTPPVRFGLARLGPDEHLLVLAFHHEVMDAGAAAQLLDELSLAYTAHRGGRRPDLPSVRADYRDFTRWHGELLDSGALDAERAAWIAELADAPHVLRMPEDAPRPPTKRNRGALAIHPFPAGLVPRLRRFSAGHRVTPFHTLLAAFATVLHRHTRAEDMVVGICGDGRPEKYRDVVGPLSCMIPVRMRTPGDLPFADLLAAARDATLTAYDRQFIPFRQVVQESLVGRDPGYSPLVQVVFNAPPLHFRPDTFPGLTMSVVHVPRGRCRFDLLFNLEWHGDDVVATVEYDTAIFAAAGVERLVDHVATAVESAMTDPDATLDTLELGPAPAASAPPPTPAADGDGHTVPTPSGPVVLRVDPAWPGGDRGEVTAVPGRAEVREPTGRPAPCGLEGVLHVDAAPVSAPDGGALRVRRMENGRLLWRMVDPPREDRPAPVGPAPARARRAPAVERRVVALCRELLDDDTITGEDDFFAVGGHSMIASRMTQTLAEEFGADVPLLFVFEHPELHTFAAAIAARHPDVAAALAELETLTDDEIEALADEPDEAAPNASTPLVPPVPRERTNALGAAEEPFWLMEQFVPGSAVNTLTLSLRVEGPLDEGALEWAFAQAIDREEILRTTYHLGEGDVAPSRRVHDENPFTIEVVDLRRTPAEEREQAAARVAAERADRGFDVSELPLIRLTVVRLDTGTRDLLLTCHHLVMDYWAVTKVLFPQIAAYYHRRTTGEGELPASRTTTFRDVVAAERRRAATGGAEEQRRYWHRRLAGLRELSLPTDHPRPQTPSFDGDVVYRLAPPAVRDAVYTFAARERVTPFIVVAAALSAVVRQWSGQDDVQLLTPCENRLDLDAADVMGAFVNLLVLRFDDFAPDTTWREHLTRTRAVVAGAYANQSCPAGDALRAAGADSLVVGGRGSYVTLNVFQAESGFTLTGCRVHPGRIVANTKASTDLEVSTLIVEDGLLFDVKYRTALWERASVERFAAACEAALRALVENPDAALCAPVEDPDATLRAPVEDPDAAMPGRPTGHA